MAITKIQTGGIPALAVTHDKLHTDMDLSAKTVTLPSAVTDTITNKLPLAGGTVTGNVTVNGGGVGDNGLFVGPTGYTGSFVYKSSGDAEIAPRSGKDLIFADSTGGTGLVRIKSNGNVGIGTSSPEGTLQVENSSNNALILNAPANRYNSVGFQTAGTDKWWLGRADSDQIASDAFFIGTDAGNAIDPGGLNAKLVIAQSGNVGIGTSSPYFKMSLNGGMRIENLSSSPSSGSGTEYGYNTSSHEGFQITRTKGVGTSTYRPFIHRAEDIRFGTGTSSTTERMRIASSGNVGIGDLGNAATLLHIGSTGTPELRVQDLDAGGGYLSITHNAGTSTISADPSNSSGSPTLVFNTVNTERMRIDSSGRVTMPNQPFFYAKNIGAGSQAGDGITTNPAIFPTATQNIGNCLSNTNSRFTAPIAGRYFISGNPGYKQSNVDFAVRLKINGSDVTDIIRLIGGTPSSHSGGTFTAIIYLNASDYVELNMGAAGVLAYHRNSSSVPNWWSGGLL